MIIRFRVFSLKEMTALLQRIKEEPLYGSFILMTHVRVVPGLNIRNAVAKRIELKL